MLPPISIAERAPHPFAGTVAVLAELAACCTVVLLGVLLMLVVPGNMFLLGVRLRAKLPVEGTALIGVTCGMVLAAMVGRCSSWLRGRA